MEETFIFENNSQGTVSIDFFENGRQCIKGFCSDFEIECWTVQEDGTLDLCIGWGVKKVMFGNLVRKILFTGLFGNGIIKITKKQS